MAILPRTLAMLVLALSACETIPVNREAQVPVAVILPNRMCATRGKVAVSTDKPGERMICEMQEPLGSHLPKCTCWDEGALASKREDTQEMVRELSMTQQCGGAAICPGSTH
jgi:hypothetical protein